MAFDRLLKYHGQEHPWLEGFETSQSTILGRVPIGLLGSSEMMLFRFTNPQGDNSVEVGWEAGGLRFQVLDHIEDWI